MATATMTTVNPILKAVYAPRIEDQLHNEINILKRIEHTSDGLVESPGGKYVSLPLRVTRNSGIGSRLENENTPVAGTQGYAEIQVPLRYDYGSVRLTGQLLKLAVTNVQAFASGADREMEGLKDDLVKNTNRVVQGDGTGLLAKVTADGANTVTVDSVQYLEVGFQIDILTRATGAAIASDRTITAITGLVVTYSGADVTAAATEGLYRQGNFTGAVQREATGLASIIGSGLLHNLNSSTQTKWQSSILANSGTPRALAEGLMIQMVDNIRIASGEVPTVIFGSLGVRRAYFNLLTQQRRFTDTKTYDGGMQGLAFHAGPKEIPMVDDVDAPASKLRFVNEKMIKLLKACDWEWADEGGNVLTKVSGVDAYEGLMRKFWELATSARNTHGEIQDIIEG